LRARATMRRAAQLGPPARPATTPRPRQRSSRRRSARCRLARRARRRHRARRREALCPAPRRRRSCPSRHPASVGQSSIAPLPLSLAALRRPLRLAWPHRRATSALPAARCSWTCARGPGVVQKQTRPTKCTPGAARPSSRCRRARPDPARARSCGACSGLQRVACRPLRTRPTPLTLCPAPHPQRCKGRSRCSAPPGRLRMAPQAAHRPERRCGAAQSAMRRTHGSQRNATPCALALAFAFWRRVTPETLTWHVGRRDRAAAA
jgi:hypothetical protein